VLWAEVRDTVLAEVLADPPAVIVLADHGVFPAPAREALSAWVEAGGLLIRFAGPRLAAAMGEGSQASGRWARTRCCRCACAAAAGCSAAP